jgi:hypothetical protein
LLTLAGPPDVARADGCSSLLSAINQLKAHIPNEPRDAADDDRAVLAQYVSLYNNKCTGGPSSSAGRSSAPAPSDAARQRCEAAFDRALSVASHREMPEAVLAFFGGDCTGADAYRRYETEGPEAILDAVQQCEGIKTITHDGQPVSASEAAADLAKAREKSSQDAMQCLINGIGRPPPAPAPSTAPRTATAPAVAKPPRAQPDPDADEPIPSDLDVAMFTCLRIYGTMGVAIDSARDAVTRCASKYPAVFGSATTDQIAAAFTLAKQKEKPAATASPPRKPAPTTAAFPNTDGTCVAWTNPRRTQCASDEFDAANCSCVTYHNFCGQMITIYYSVIGASDSSPGVLTLNNSDSGPACTGHRNESIQFQSWRAVPGGKF